MFRIRGPLLATIAFMTFAIPLAADITGITTTPINIPANPVGLTVGPDGNVWILNIKNGSLGRLTPAGTYTEFPLQFGAHGGDYFTFGPDGNLWITGSNGHIERVSTSGAVTDFAVAPSLEYPHNPVAGADGAIWFFDRLLPGPNTPNASGAWKLGRIDIYGQVTTYDLGISGDSLDNLVSGGDGNLWFIDETTSQVVTFSIVTRSVAGTFALPSPSAQNQAGEMILAWDGNVWFPRGTSIDRVTVDGTITEFHVPSGNQPTSILMSGDGNIWFMDFSPGTLGQLVMSSITSGGSATINESSAVLPETQALILLPSAFAGLSATALGLRVVPNDACPPPTYLAEDTYSKLQKVSLPPPSGCYDELKALNHLVLSSNDFDKETNDEIIFLSILASPPGFSPNSLELRPSSAGSGSVTASVNVSAPPGTTITRIDTSDPSLTVSFSGLTATITKSAMATGDSFTAAVHVSVPSGAQSAAVAGAVVVSSSISDSNPFYHIASFFFDPSSLGNRVALPSNPPTIVPTPVTRGK